MTTVVDMSMPSGCVCAPARWAVPIDRLAYAALIALLLAIVIRHDRPDQLYHLDAAPYLVNIYARGGHGTLIAPRWVLTAAHVVHSLQPGHEVSAGGQTIAVRRIILHPGWKSPQTNVVDDIALLELEHPAQAQPVSIYRRRDEAGRTVTFGFAGSAFFSWTARLVAGNEWRIGSLTANTSS